MKRFIKMLFILKKYCFVLQDGELAALRGHMEIKHQQTLLNLKNDFQSRIMDLTDENSRLRADLETKSEKVSF